jgi:transcriptional regulator with XRE-family HTH domain
MSTVGDRILCMRKQVGLTQEELAKKMGYKSKSTINKIELGINDIPQSKIFQFAEVLGTTPAYLMGWDEEENSLDKVELTEGEKVWMELYHKLSDETRVVLVNMAEAFEKLPADRQRFLLDAARVVFDNQK